jgi:hypothetical protein
VKLEEKLALAVRNSLNLPELKVSVRSGKSHRNWGFRLHHEGASSDWLELDAESIRIMKEVGLLPALHLGTFRVAYAALRRAREERSRKPE